MWAATDEAQQFRFAGRTAGQQGNLRREQRTLEPIDRQIVEELWTEIGPLTQPSCSAEYCMTVLFCSQNYY